MLKRLATGALFFAAGWFVATWQPPCTSPLTYRIGRVDSGFGLSEGEVRAALERAERVWESPQRPALFGHDDDGVVVVNFLYDNRQRVAQENAVRRGRIETTKERADRLQARHGKATASYKSLKAQFARAQSSHDARMAAHNRTVDMWNTRGGAPAGEFDALRREQAELEKEAAALERTRVRVNAFADRANRLSDRYNRMAGRINENVDAINTSAGREFKQGLFTSDARGMRIDVYEYTSMDDLVHVLAHELGHALGLGHNDDPQSIMYGLNSSKTAVLTAEDRRQLAERCGG